MSPFAEVPTLEFLCSFYDSDGKPLESAPEYVLRKADEEFTRRTGCTFKTLGELEYYVVSPRDDLYPGRDQKGYHSAEPFVKFADLRDEAMRLIARAGGRIKYGHSEVGCFYNDDAYYEQHEIEFLPMPVEQAVEQLIVAKWVLRMLGNQYGVEISFAPEDHRRQGRERDALPHARREGRQEPAGRGGQTEPARPEDDRRHP